MQRVEFIGWKTQRPNLPATDFFEQQFLMPSEYLQIYQTFEQKVNGLNQAIAERNDFASLKESITNLQIFFQTHIWMFDLDELSPASAHQMRSFNVEIDKQLRLLGMDVMFLQSAKQPSTIDQRLNHMSDRLTLLLRYCNGLLEGRK